MNQVENSSGIQGSTGLTLTSRSCRNLIMECSALRHEVEVLKDALAKGKACCSDHENSIMELSKQLDETKTELTRQKKLKEMFINKGKETKRELERLKAYSNPHTLSTAKIAAQVRDTTREKKKKVLHKDYEELQVAHIISQEMFTAELQTEKEKNRVLQAELETINASHHEVNQRYAAEIISIRQRADTLQCEREKESQQKKILLEYYQELQETHRRSQETLTAELQAANKEKALLQQELDSIKVSYHEDHLRYETEVANIRQQASALQLELEKESQQKTVLQKEYAQLQAALIHGQETSSVELQEEKEKNKLLQEELEEIRLLYQEISQKYETVVLTGRQLDKEIKTHSESLSEGWSSINKLKAEKEALCQTMAEERENLKLKERLFEREMGALKSQLSIQIARNQQLYTELEADKEYCLPRKVTRHEEKREDEPLPAPAMEPTKETEASEELLCEQQESTSDAPALELQEVDEISETLQTNTPSVWKRTRHFLGLRKPEKWKKKE